MEKYQEKEIIREKKVESIRPIIFIVGVPEGERGTEERESINSSMKCPKLEKESQLHTERAHQVQ